MVLREKNPPDSQLPRNPRHLIRAVPCEVYSRVVGYYRPVQNWNEGKQQEFADRHLNDLPKLSE